MGAPASAPTKTSAVVELLLDNSYGAAAAMAARRRARLRRQAAGGGGLALGALMHLEANRQHLAEWRQLQEDLSR